MRSRDQAALQKLVEKYSGRRLPPVRARVVRAAGSSGGRADELQPRYAVDVQVLRRDWSEDTDWPVLPDVEVPVLWAGPKRGVYALPKVKSIVRLGFYYDDPSQPFVDAVLGYGHELPGQSPDELVIAQGDGVEIRIGADGRVKVRGNGIDLVGGEGVLSELVRRCDTCSFTGVMHPASSTNVRSS